MKEIKAFIQPYMKSDVLDALEQIDELPGLTISEVSGWGRTKAANVDNPVHVGPYQFAAKIKLEIVVPDHLCETIVETIEEHARTGKPGDGKIFVYDVGGAVRIRTGERDDEAI